MAKNIKTTTIPPKLAPYISIIPKNQIESSQVQNVTESSLNQPEYGKTDKDTNILSNKSINIQNDQSSNSFSSSDIKPPNEIIKPNNAITSIIPNKTSLIPQKQEIIPQFPKTQNPLINQMNSNETLINSGNLSNRSNIDIILNNSNIEERSRVDHHTNNLSLNLNKQNKNEIIVTKNNNNIPYQVISPKNLINTNMINTNTNNSNFNDNNNSTNMNNTGNIMTNNNNNLNQKNNLNNHNIEISILPMNNSNGNEIDIKPIVNDNNTINTNGITENNVSLPNYDNGAILKVIPNTPNPKTPPPKNKKSPAYRKVMWTHAEDQLLIKTISRHGTNNWELVSNEVAGRTRKQCRERWAGILNPSLTKQPWTTEEDETLKMLHAQYGNKWALIAAQMKGRSTIALRNRWSFHMRHSYREAKQQAPFRFIIENRNGDFNNDQNQLNPAIQQQQPPPPTQPQQQLPIQNQSQLQLIQVVPNPYQQVQQQNICGVYPVLNQHQQQQKTIFQPNQIRMQNMPHYQPIQIIQQHYEPQPLPPQLVNAPMNIVELPKNGMNNPPNFC